MAGLRPSFDLGKFVAAIETKGVEATLLEAGKDLLLLTWKLSQIPKPLKKTQEKSNDRSSHSV